MPDKKSKQVVLKMGLVHVDNLEVDMVLSEDVRDIKSRLLLTKGQKIQSKHIRIFKIWGITEVGVVEENRDKKNNTEIHIDPDKLERITEETEFLFKHVDLSHPAIQELFRISLLHRSRQEVDNRENIAPASGDDLKAHSIRDVKKMIDGREIKLPEMPSTAFELNEIVADPTASAHSIAEVVNKSPSLATLLLKIVNSSFYGFPSKINNISRAVTIIGTREITGLALGLSIVKAFKDIPKEVIDISSFLRHSIACGIISRILAAKKNIPQTEQMFVAGLLHDIGRLIIYQYFPEQAMTLLSQAAASDNLLFQQETRFLGGNHSLIGQYLLKEWKLPFELQNNIFFHHNPLNAHDPIKATIIHLADIMVNALRLGSSGERFVPFFDEKAWENLEMSPGNFETIIQHTIHQLVPLESFFQG
ncbi:MAG: HDOD domain-containing protein [Desulfobacterales bacterium]